MSYMTMSLYRVTPEVKVFNGEVHLQFNGFDTYAALGLNEAEKLQRDLAEAIATLREAAKAEAA